MRPFPRRLQSTANRSDGGPLARHPVSGPIGRDENGVGDSRDECNSPYCLFDSRKHRDLEWARRI
jgi:hypothetical protein